MPREPAHKGKKGGVPAQSGGERTFKKGSKAGALDEKEAAQSAETS